MLQGRLAAVLMMPLALGCLPLLAQSRPAVPLLAFAAPGSTYDVASGYSSSNSSSSDTASNGSIDAPSMDGAVPQSSSQEKEIVLPPLVGHRKALETRHMGLLSAVAVGVKVDSLGFGVEVATPLSRSFNLRVGANLLNYTYTFGVDGMNYNTQILFNSGQVSLDWFPFHGGFHIGPGAVYFNNRLNALLSAPAGQTFELGDDTYTNSTTDPVHGSAAFSYGRKIAPAVVAGFGNILPRSGRHLSVPVEFGAAFLGSAQVKLALQGTACQSDGCFNMATDPDYQYSLQQEQGDINETLKKFQVYPIFSTGLSYRF